MNLKKIKGQYQKKKEEGNRKKKGWIKNCSQPNIPKFCSIVWQYNIL